MSPCQSRALQATRYATRSETAHAEAGARRRHALWIDHQQRQVAPSWPRWNPADSPGAHPAVESLGMGIRCDPQANRAHRVQLSQEMSEERAPDARSHVLRPNPHVLELGRRAPARERVEAEDAGTANSAVDGLAVDEVRRQGELCLPESNEPIGISPVALRRMGDSRETARLGLPGPSNSNLHRSAGSPGGLPLHGWKPGPLPAPDDGRQDEPRPASEIHALELGRREEAGLEHLVLVRVEVAVDPVTFKDRHHVRHLVSVAVLDMELRAGEHAAEADGLHVQAGLLPDLACDGVLRRLTRIDRTAWGDPHAAV